MYMNGSLMMITCNKQHHLPFFISCNSKALLSSKTNWINCLKRRDMSTYEWSMNISPLLCRKFRKRKHLNWWCQAPQSIRHVNKRSVDYNDKFILNSIGMLGIQPYMPINIFYECQRLNEWIKMNEWMNEML